MAPQEVIEEVKTSHCGAAAARASHRAEMELCALPARMRRIRNIWSPMRDEMEPGTFKDRLLMEGDPHQLIEGMIIAGIRDRHRRRLHFSAR